MITTLYGFVGVIGGSWVLQGVLERQGKDEEARLAQAVGYGTIVAAVVKFSLEVKNFGSISGVW